MANTNAQLAAVFAQMAAVAEILGQDRFRTIALQRASRVIADLPDDLATIGPDTKALAAIDGIGKGTAERIAEFLNTGRVNDHDELLSQIPDGLPALLDIPGLGPKTIALLWNNAGIESLDDLRAKLEGEQLAKLPGMGKKKIENLRKSIAFAEAAADRVSIGRALPMALWFLGQLRAHKSVIDAAYAGSLRRGRETIGDIDLLVSADTAKPGAAESISDLFVSLEPVEDVLVKGATKTSIRTSDHLQADLRIVPPESYGAALMYFTGSKDHNVSLRQRAIAMGCSLNEYSLSRDGKPIAGKTEQDVYKALDLPWIPPELREDRGEIRLAESDKLSKLIEHTDIRAELHAHTTASDGKWSIRDYALTCADLGYHTVAVTDHSQSQPIANGLSPERLEKHIEAVRAVAKDLADTITVLAGSEVDILADGSLDYPNSLLKQLDVVVASPHHALGQDPKKATQRLIKAIRNPYVTILGHPTGRLITRREGLSPDMKQIIVAAADRGIALEINANHWRLDLRDTHARAAIEAGVKLAINTDAHGPADLGEIIYGTLTARRAGATANDVVNCMTKAALAKWIESSRQ